MIQTTIWVRTKHDEGITIFLLQLLPQKKTSILRNHELSIVLDSTFTDTYRPIFGQNRELLIILIYIYYRTKYSNDITHTFTGSYLVSSSLLTDKILARQQPIDRYNFYSRIEPRASNRCQLKDSNKRGMLEYQKTLQEATTKSVRLSGFHYYPNLLDGIQSRRKRGMPQALSFIDNTQCLRIERQH